MYAKDMSKKILAAKDAQRKKGNITLSKVTFFPSAVSNFSKNTTSPSATLYCFPQLSITAYI